MIRALLGLVPPWAYLGAVAVFFAMAWAWVGLQKRAAYKAGHEAATAAMQAKAKQDTADRGAANERVTDAYIKQVQSGERAAAGARAESERLREQLAAISPQHPAASAAADGAASPIAELLGACAERYQGVAAEADRLAGQVAGLQQYARDVCVNEPGRP